MSISIEKIKALKKIILKASVKVHLRRKIDWKVSRAISTGQELEDSAKDYRASVVAEFDKRIEALESATTIEAVSSIPLGF